MEILLFSPSATCPFVGKYTEEGLPRSLIPFLLLPLMYHMDYGVRIIVLPTTGLISIAKVNVLDNGWTVKSNRRATQGWQRKAEQTEN